MKVKGMLSMIATMSILLFSVGSCSSPSDPAAAWLLALADPSSSAAAPTGTAQFDLNTSVTKGSADFLFKNTTTITVNINVVNPFNAPATGSMVRITQPGTTSQVIFSAVSDSNGNVSGSFTVNPDTSVVTLTVVYNGVTYTRDITITAIDLVNGTIVLSATSGEHVVLDSDGDGIPDFMDQYPNDPTRAATVVYPGPDSYYTVAYEDLYPVPGDADFNDYAVRVRYEEDLNAQGQIVRVRGDFTHVARGAGYTHTLNLILPGVSGYNYTLTRYGYDGTTVEYTNTAQQSGALQILPKSSTTIQSSNTSSGQTFVIGKRAVVEFIFDQPVARTALGTVPYDLYIYVNNTKKEIHFAGLYKKSDGTDQYLDSNGFPWALMMPGNWFWPYEAKDIRNAYPQFQTWYQSYGTTGADWYKTFTAGLVFQY